MRFYLTILFSAYFMLSSFAQEGKEVTTLQKYYDSKYGIDPNLHEGYLYVRDIKANRTDPFFLNSNEVECSLVYNGISFKHVNLFYDLHRQLLVLGYLDNNDAYREISLIAEKVEGFTFIKPQSLNQKNIHNRNVNNYNTQSIGDKAKEYYFKRNSCPEIPTPYFHVVLEGKVTCYVTYEKILEFDNAIGTYDYSDKQRKIYLQKNSAVNEISSKRKLLSLYEKDTKKQIKTFLRARKKRYSKYTTEDLKALFVFLNTLSE